MHPLKQRFFDQTRSAVPEPEPLPENWKRAVTAIESEPSKRVLEFWLEAELDRQPKPRKSVVGALESELGKWR